MLWTDTLVDTVGVFNLSPSRCCFTTLIRNINVNGYNVTIMSAANVANVILSKPSFWVGKHASIHLSVNKTVFLFLMWRHRQDLAASKVTYVSIAVTLFWKQRAPSSLRDDKVSLALEQITLPSVLLTTFVMVPLLCFHVRMSNPKLQFIHQNS